jgi:glycosyltransferase involved in cell wall biosynthesis
VACVHGQSEMVIDDLAQCEGYLDRVISVSRKGVQSVRERLPGLAERLLHIPTGVPARRRESERSKDSLEVVYVGRLDNAEKRVFDLVPLVKRLSDAKIIFHIVGDGADAATLNGSLEEEAESGRVVFHGRLSRGSLYDEIYPKMDALLVLSASEGGPITAWEALAHGLVPVVSDYCGRAEEGVLMDQKSALVFSVGDVAAAERALRQMLAVKLDEGRGALRPLLPDEYRWDTFSRSWNEVLQDCVDGHRRHAHGKLPRMISDGRLARLNFGIAVSCRLRKLFGGRFPHEDAGGEWPHAYGLGKGS